MKKIPHILLPLLVLGVSSFATYLMVKFRRTATPAPKETLVPAVETKALERVDLPIRIESQGTIEAAKTVRLIAEVDGRITEISPALKRGGFFESAERLVVVDPRDYQLAVTRASAQVASARLRLTTVEAEADIAAKDWQDLGENGEPSALLLRQPQLAEARSTLAAAEADLEKATLDLERTQMNAPFTGRVRRASVEVGQFVRRGEELAVLFGVEEVEVMLPIPLSDLGALDLPVERTPEAMRAADISVILTGRFGRQTHQWPGQVVRVDGEIDIDSRMASVVAQVADPYGLEKSSGGPPLRVGMFVTAEIEARVAEDVIVVPRVHVIDNRRALAVDRDEKLRIRELEILRADRDSAVVTAGFEAGDRLCLSAIETPIDGLQVKVSNPNGGQP